MIRRLLTLILALGIYTTSNADATLIGTSISHYMFNYHGIPVFCPIGAPLFSMIDCVGDRLQDVTCHVLPQAQGFIDCGHTEEQRT